jgi:hypothetical protein
MQLLSGTQANNTVAAARTRAGRIVSVVVGLELLRSHSEQQVEPFAVGRKTVPPEETGHRPQEQFDRAQDYLMQAPERSNRKPKYAS